MTEQQANGVWRIPATSFYDVLKEWELAKGLVPGCDDPDAYWIHVKPRLQDWFMTAGIEQVYGQYLMLGGTDRDTFLKMMEDCLSETDCTTYGVIFGAAARLKNERDEWEDKYNSLITDTTKALQAEADAKERIRTDMQATIDSLESVIADERAKVNSYHKAWTETSEQVTQLQDLLDQRNAQIIRVLEEAGRL